MFNVSCLVPVQVKIPGFDLGDTTANSRSRLGEIVPFRLHPLGVGVRSMGRPFRRTKVVEES